MSYSIEIYYKTGDSFNSYNETDKIGMVFKDIKDAEKALSIIGDHYKFVQKLENDTRIMRNRREIIEQSLKELRGKEWYQPNPEIKFQKEIDGSEKNRLELFDFYWQHYIYLPVDGEKKHIETFWVGHFETPISAKIVLEKEHELFF